MFLSVKLFQVSNSVSDHSILVLRESGSPRWLRHRSKLFRFESMWLGDGGCNEVVEEAWERG